MASLKKFVRYSNKYYCANLLFIFLILLLPYYLFEGRLFLGGDDTRFYYAYPKEVLNSFTIYSWNNISSLPSYIPNHHWLPFVLFASVLDSILSSKQQLFYFLFSLNLILGFVYFQKFVREALGKDYSVSFISSLIYVFSPITIVTASFFLSATWLIALFPIIVYYFIAFLKRGRNQDIVKVVLWSLLFSFAFYSIPWILALVFPFIVSIILFVIFIINPIRKYVRRVIIFSFFIISSQLFWLTSFIHSLIVGGSGSLGAYVISKDLSNSFRLTVETTATGNIINPLLTLYHRQIAFDYDWQLVKVFLGYYDLVLPFSFVFILTLFLGLLNYKKSLSKSQTKLFIFILMMYIIVLFLFTVNISFLKDLFILLGNAPGFGIFKNFTDKFALSYIFIYSTILSLCLFIIKKSFRLYKLYFLVMVFVVVINLLPIKSVFNSPLWKTKDVYPLVNLSEEYLIFSEEVSKSIPNDSNIISFPQNIAAYSIITEDNEKNAYIGTSPMKFLTGINDLTGGLSFPGYISDSIQELIEKKDYERLLIILNQLNIGYLMETKNIPEEVLNGYLFDSRYLAIQDSELINSIVEKEIIRSKDGNYILYKLKNNPKILSANNVELSYKKINPISYEIKLKNLNGEVGLDFKESYHKGWSLVLDNGKKEFGDMNLNSIFNRFIKSSLNASHEAELPYGNKWIIDSKSIKSEYSNDYYLENGDGSIDLNLKLYFMPQYYFYCGIALTIIFLTAGFIYLRLTKENDKTS